jgi:hypothetical protein
VEQYRRAEVRLLQEVELLGRSVHQKEAKMSFPEGVVQDGFTRWYKAQTGYQEKYFDDYSGLKTSVDSVGFIGSTPVIIEFKGYVRSDLVYYADRRGGSLEDKIYRALRALCGQRSDDISHALITWDGQTAPLILIVVGGMSDEGQRKICDMLLDRARQWGFRPQLWLWTGSEGKLICELEETDTVVLDCGQLALLDMPYVPNNREKPRTLEQFREIAAKREIGELLDAFCEEARSRGGRLSRNSINFNYRFRDLESRNLLTIVGAWPFDATVEKGLVVSYWPEAFSQCFGTVPVPDQEMPGIETTKRGFLGPSRCLRTVDEVRLFWQLFAGKPD